MKTTIVRRCVLVLAAIMVVFTYGVDVEAANRNNKLGQRRRKTGSLARGHRKLHSSTDGRRIKEVKAQEEEEDQSKKSEASSSDSKKSKLIKGARSSSKAKGTAKKQGVAATKVRSRSEEESRSKINSYKNGGSGEEGKL